MAPIQSTEKKDETTTGSNNPKMSTIQGGRQKEETKPGEMASATSEFFRKEQEFVKDVAEKTKQVATDVTDKAGEYLSDASKEVNTVLRKYPLQSLLAGFGLGCLVGVLVGRK